MINSWLIANTFCYLKYINAASAIKCKFLACGEVCIFQYLIGSCVASGRIWERNVVGRGVGMKDDPRDFDNNFQRHLM